MCCTCGPRMMTAMSIWIEYNPNPEGRRIDDCAIRALCRALGVNWPEASVILSAKSLAMGTTQTDKATVNAVLHERGFRRRVLPDTCPDCYTAAMFAMDHPEGLFVICFDNHIAVVEGGRLFDSWDSSREIPLFYWKKEVD